MLKNFRKIMAEFPDHPQVRKMVVIPTKSIYINRTAAADAKVIRLVQDIRENVPYFLYTLRD